jgi:hypothetical protein
MGSGVAGDHQKVTQARRLEVPGQSRMELGIVAESQAISRPRLEGAAWRWTDPGTSGTTGPTARRVCRRAEPAERRHADLRGDGPRSRASDSLLGCFVSRQAPMSARLDDAPDRCERSQRLHQASSGREAVAGVQAPWRAPCPVGTTP